MRGHSSFVLLSTAWLSGCPGNLVPQTQLTRFDQDVDCPAGGSRLSVGRDLDQDGHLSDQEIDTSQVICDAQPHRPVPGPQGVPGLRGPQGSPGMSSGFDAVVAQNGGTHTTLQAAVESGAKRILLRRGHHPLTEDLVLTDHTLLQGEGPGATHIEGHFLVRAQSGIIIRDITLGTTGGQGGLQAEGDDNLFENVHVFTQGTNTGLRSGNRTVVRNCRFGAANFPLSVGDESHVVGNIFVGEASIHLTAGRASTVTDNRVTSSGSSDGIQAGPLSEIRGNWISGVAEIGNVGIRTHSGSRVVGNHIDGFVVGLDFEAELGGGIIESNTVYNTGGFGIAVDTPNEPGFGYTVVGSNVVLSAGTTAYSLDGLRMVVRSNTAAGAGESCYEIKYARDLVMTGNLAQNCGQHGFNIDIGWDGLMLTDNHATDCQEAGFKLQGRDSLFSGNIARRNQGPGFDVQDVSQSSFIGNLARDNEGEDYFGTPSATHFDQNH